MAKERDQFGQRKLKYSRPGLFWHLLHLRDGDTEVEEGEDGAAG